MCSFFDLFCVCIDDWVELWVGSWKGSNFKFSRGPQNYILGICKPREQFDADFC